ncbi:MAG: hypothetical protein A2020_13375 [Lentisphaerae bacterium GWF2_45_14]|nr:MAG: hypothetical protein A2020_13375 [Lentisphaerae bacterium GWF2_45_14]
MPHDIKSIFEKKLRSALSGQERIRPELYVYAGLLEEKMIEDIRRNVPQGTFLLYLFQYEKGLDVIKYDSDTFFLPLALDENLSHDLIWLTAGALRIERYYFSSAAGFPSDIAEKLMSIVDNAVINVTNEKNYGLLKLRASIQNIPLIMNDSENSWIPAGKDFPVLVCGAGPSLKYQMELIKLYQNNIIIIAAGRTGIILENAGINPDFIVYADAEGFGETLNPQSPVLVGLTSISHKKALSFKDRIWTEGDSIYFNRYMRRKGFNLGKLSFSGTATVTALDMALKLDAGSVAVAGNDYCLSEQGDFHADSSGAEETYKGDIFRIPGNDTETVPTIKELDLLRKSLETYLESSPGTEIFNCTEGGACVSGMKRMQLNEFLEKYASSRPKSSIQLFKKGSPQRQLINVTALKHDIKEFMDAVDVYVRDIKDCGPCRSPDEQAFRKLRKDLAEDIMRDLTYVGSGGLDAKYESRSFSAFRNYAISLVSHKNSLFAEFLKKRHDFAGTVPFRISSRSQEFPIVELSDGKRFIKLNDSNNFIASAIRKFKEVRSFDPVRGAMVIPVGGNWNYAVEFARNFPESRLLLVEALPDLFSTTIDIAMFTQYFRTDTVIIGAHQSLEHWLGLLKEKLMEIKAADLKAFCFVPPHTEKIPLLDETAETVRRAIRDISKN